MSQLGLASKTLLFPYWLTLVIRNKLYDKGILKGERFSIPVISLGNITVGGTGKTPHTEMVVRELRGKCRLAVISRGYKRKSKGFHVVKVTDDFTLCGDEPLQIKKKFPEIIVAVCKDRNYAIHKVVEEMGANLVILDDAYQYRKVIPSFNVLLVNYNKTIAGDNLLPIGHLRDLPSQVKRADAVIITKSPNFSFFDGNIDDEKGLEITTEQEKVWRKSLKLREDQRLYFSTALYDAAQPVFTDICNVRYIYSKFAVAFTGIADDTLFRSQLGSTHKIEEILKFKDHKNFSRSNIRSIEAMAQRQKEAAVITTEKDSMRLKNNKYLSDQLKERLFYLPIGSKIIPTVKKEEFLAVAVTPPQKEEK
ncbi:MAG: tetraacyldisaccharide 4'-kinase [Bacteroidales bacterium]|nr:tetraacyldisaccharide 4'-kinase [Bacteroidales bacterium]